MWAFWSSFEYMFGVSSRVSNVCPKEVPLRRLEEVQDVEGKPTRGNLPSTLISSRSSPSYPYIYPLHYFLPLPGAAFALNQHSSSPQYSHPPLHENCKNRDRAESVAPIS